MDKINCIVIIDDDPICTFITEGVCVKTNMAEEVVSFSNALDALQFISQYACVHSLCPELIIVDIHMPDINGFEFIQKMNAMPLKNAENVVLIGISASSRPSWKLKSSNFREFLVKPFSIKMAHLLVENYFTGANQSTSATA